MAGKDSPLQIHPTDLLIGNAPAVQALRQQVRRLVAFDAVGNPKVPTLLLRGETGTGKSLVARLIHDSGPRADGPFIDVNCAAIPETLLEAELFGFEAGAFTDAKRAKPGLFEAASGGTLFLDEVDALPLALQGKLLHAIEEKRVRRLGAVADRRVDVKLMAATKADLGRHAAEGRFRADLFHRLAVLVLDLPPLRDRGEDGLLLARHFLQRQAEAHGVPPKRLSREAEAWILRYGWPGNVRELSHLMERAILLSPDTELEASTLERLSLELRPAPAAGEMGPLHGDLGTSPEQERIRRALRQTGGNVVRAARLLGMSRNALRHRMRRYGIERPSWQGNAEPDPGHRGAAVAFRTTLSSATPGAEGRSVAETLRESGASVPRVSHVVGRAVEFRRLETWLNEALRGQRHVVFVTGEPGIGKTTLVKAFVEQVAAGQSARLAAGQCVEQYGAGEAYLPVLEALERLGRAKGGDELIGLLRQHAPAWLVQMPSLVAPGERERLQRSLGGATQERMLREMAAALEAFTTQRALVLVLEDLQWSDYSTLSLLACLARRAEPARLMVVGTYRPADVFTGQHPLRGIKQELELHGQCDELALRFLTEAEVAEYLAARFGRGGLPEALARMIHRRTDGNPLFMNDLVEYLVAKGAIGRPDGEWDLGKVVAEVQQGVPLSIRELIERQIDGLVQADQRVLEAASVAGAEFSAAAVAAGLDAEVGEVEQRCVFLARDGRFLHLKGTAEWPDGTAATGFSFLHALYQEVLYQRVPAARRIEFHRKIGEREEQAYGIRSRERAPELAVHFERGRDPERAIQYRRQAGENALTRSAHLEAIRHLTRALELLRTLPEGPDRARWEVLLLTILGPAWMVAKGYAAPEVERTYTRVLELCRMEGESPELFRGLRGLWSYHLVRADLRRAHELGQELLTRVQGRADGQLLVQAHAQMGETLFHLGQLVPARLHLDAAIGGEAGGRPLPRTPQIPRVASYSAWALWYLGYPDQALRRIEEALVVAKELARPHDLAFALGFAVWLHHFRRDVAGAKERAEEEMTLCRDYGLPYWLPWGTMLQGWVLAERGQAAEGIVRMREGLEAYRATGAEVGLPHFLAALAEVCGKAGRADEGLTFLAEALKLMEANDNRYHEPELYRLRGELLLAVAGFPDDPEWARGSVPAEAETSLRQAIDVARRQQARSLELRAVLSASRLWHSQGRSLEARPGLTEILGQFTEGFDTADLREAKTLLDFLG